MLTEWVAPGKGASLGAIKALINGIHYGAPTEWKIPTSLYVDFLGLMEGKEPEEKDRARLHEVLRRFKDGESL